MEKTFLEEIELLYSKVKDGRCRYKKDLYIFLEDLEKVCNDHRCAKIKNKIKGFGMNDLDKELTKRQQSVLLQEIEDIIKKCNGVEGEDDAFWSRTRLIDFESKFVKPQDLREKNDTIPRKIGNSTNSDQHSNSLRFYPTNNYWKNNPTIIHEDDMGRIIKEFLESFARDFISSSVVNYVFDYLSLSSVLLEENTQYLTLHLSILDILREEGWDFDENGGFSREPNNKRIYEKLSKLVTFSP